MKNNSEYKVLLPSGPHQEPWFEFPEGQGKLAVGSRPWRVSPKINSASTHEKASTCESLLNIYNSAIEIGGPSGTSEKSFAAVAGVSVGVINFLIFGWMLSFASKSYELLIILAAMVLFLLVAWFFFRLGFFTPRDLPVLFNKRTRKVSIFESRAISFWRFWESPTIKEIVTVDWDVIQVRSYKTLQMNGEIPRDTYNLALLWGEEDNPRQFKNFAYIGYLGWWEDAMLWRLWEHIRRYMEEDGPPIQPGETLRTSGTGKLPKFPDDIIAAAGGPPMSREEVEALSRRLRDEEQARNEAQP